MLTTTTTTVAPLHHANAQKVDEESALNLYIRCDALLTPVKKIIGVIALRQVAPILANIKLVAEGQSLTLTATDTKIELITHTQLEQPVQGRQSITLPGRKLMDICKTLASDDVLHVFVQEGWVRVESSIARFKLVGMPAHGFPSVNLKGDQATVTLPLAVFCEKLNCTHFSMAQQDVRYFLNGVCLEIDGQNARFVATDGHRLALSNAVCETSANAFKQIIIPQKAVTELLRLFSDEKIQKQDMLSILMTDHHLKIESDNLTFTATLIDAQYPSYKKVIPRVGDKSAVIDCSAFKEALTRATIVMNDKFPGVTLAFNADNTLNIISYNAEQESSKETLSSIVYKGEPLSLSVNLSYLLDILNAVNTPQIKITFSNEKDSIRLEEAVDDSQSLFVIMPVTL